MKWVMIQIGSSKSRWRGGECQSAEREVRRLYQPGRYTGNALNLYSTTRENIRTHAQVQVYFFYPRSPIIKSRTLHKRSEGLFWKLSQIPIAIAILHREPRLVSDPMIHHPDSPNTVIAVNLHRIAAFILDFSTRHGEYNADRADRRDDLMVSGMCFMA